MNPGFDKYSYFRSKRERVQTPNTASPIRSPFPIANNPKHQKQKKKKEQEEVAIAGARSEIRWPPLLPKEHRSSTEVSSSSRRYKTTTSTQGSTSTLGLISTAAEQNKRQELPFLSCQRQQGRRWQPSCCPNTMVEKCQTIFNPTVVTADSNTDEWQISVKVKRYEALTYAN